MQNFKTYITQYAIQCGFDLVRITGAEEFAQDRNVALARIKSGQMNGLPWYTESRVRRGADPQELLPGARSIICLGQSYLGLAGEEQDSPGSGKVARYARVKDYHRAMKGRMKAFVRGLEERLEAPVAARWYVDDGPMLDRAAAARSGLGWFGKSTNILTPSHGSWVLLGQVITDLELEPDEPLKKTCGACVRCIDDCPTGAIVAPYVVDNTRCISYQTIENRGVIPLEMRPSIGDWVFGCDICQEVCPWNSPGEIPSEDAFQPQSEFTPLDLMELFTMDDQSFRDRFRNTPIWRSRRRGMLRNAAIVLGNQRHLPATEALGHGLKDEEPLVRGACAWALGELASPQAFSFLSASLDDEQDSTVREEIQQSLASHEATSEDPPPGVTSP